MTLMEAMVIAQSKIERHRLIVDESRIISTEDVEREVDLHFQIMAGMKPLEVIKYQEDLIENITEQKNATDLLNYQRILLSLYASILHQNKIDRIKGLI